MVSPTLTAIRARRKELRLFIRRWFNAKKKPCTPRQLLAAYKEIAVLDILKKEIA